MSTSRSLTTVLPVRFLATIDLADIATELRAEVIDAFATSDDNRFAIVDSANDDTR